MGNVEAVAAISPELGDALGKVAVFALVQGLVYLILRKSSDVFSAASGAGAARSRSFRPMRSMSVRRVLAAFSDVPFGAPVDDGGSSTSALSPPQTGVAANRAD